LAWDRAIKAIYEKTHYVVETYDKVVHSPSIEMNLPSVIALVKYQPQPKHVAFTRFNVFLRDGFRCQYCGEKHASHDLTFDHVKPRARGGVTSWENVVAACSPCNVIKDDKIEMKPFRVPRTPTADELLKAKRKMPHGYLHETWTDYLYWDSALEN
jgi:5-methylcytosine-specific restriction endonuclease McrA